MMSITIRNLVWEHKYSGHWHNLFEQIETFFTRYADVSLNSPSDYSDDSCQGIHPERVFLTYIGSSQHSIRAKLEEVD